MILVFCSKFLLEILKPSEFKFLIPEIRMFLHLAFVFFFSFYKSQAENITCLDGKQMAINDTYSSSYCAPLINWPISEATAKNFEQLDALALADYKALYSKWNKTEDLTSPTNDCLGIGWTVFCSYHYKICLNETGDT